MAERHLVELDDDECWRLLGVANPRVGRIGFTVDQHPLVLPVNYAVDERTIVVRFSGRTVLDDALGRRVAFEVDQVEPGWEGGWSVLVQGLAREAVTDAEVERARSLRLRSWAAADRELFLRIDARHGISGRAIHF